VVIITHEPKINKNAISENILKLQLFNFECSLLKFHQLNGLLQSLNMVLASLKKKGEGPGVRIYRGYIPFLALSPCFLLL
jgi:hypothetical protein